MQLGTYDNKICSCHDNTGIFVANHFGFLGPYCSICTAVDCNLFHFTQKHEACNTFALFRCVNAVLGVWTKLPLKGDYNAFFIS